MPLSAADFAKRVREKNPGAYDDIPDDELTKRVLEKHPEYADMVSGSVVPSAAPQPSPAAARVANVVKARGGDPSESGWDYAKAALKGVARAVGIPTSVEELKQSEKDAVLGVLSAGAIPAAKQTVGMIQKGVDAFHRAQEAPTAARAVQAGVSGVPFVGEPAAAVAGPALAYSEGRAPTHRENVDAVEGGVSLAAQGAMVLAGKAASRSAAAKARVANVLAAKGVPAEAEMHEAAMPTDEPPPPTSTDTEPSEAAAQKALLDGHRRIATKNVYDKHVSRLDEADVDPGERYRVDELFDKNSKPEDVAAGKEIYDAFAKTRELLKEQHGDTMELARYEAPEDLQRPDKTVTHWYEPDDPNLAGHAEVDGVKRTLRVEQVPVDDIVAAPFRGKGKVGQEYVVLNRASEALADPTATPHVDNANPIPSVTEVTAAAKKLAPVKEFIDGINPAGASEGAASAADILRDSKATIANASALERYKNADLTKSFDRAGDGKNIESISNYELTGRFMAGDAFPDQASADAYSKMYQETTDAAHATLQEVYGDDRVGYVENYVRRAFKFGTATDEAKASGVLSNYVGSLSASKSPLKGRVLSVPLDDALTQMRAAGIDVKPATTNPETLRQWTVENANQARVYKQAWTDAKDGNLIQFVGQGDRVPQGMVQLNDRVAQVFRPTEEGAVRTGQYFAEPGVARIFNNAISKGLGGSPTFQAIRAMNNAYNQMQLGLSGFHLTGTAINAGISDLALGLQQIINGDVGAGAKSIGRSALPAYSFTRDMLHGRAFINDLLADDPVARQVLEEKFNPAGGRLAIDQSYRNSAYDNMVKAWSNKRYVRALGNVPFAVVQKIASPLMEYAIPRVKIGAFMDLADAERAKLGPNATPTEVQRAYERAWDSIDNRFGQVVHDNLFWNRTAADLAQVSTRSVGWNLGTIREIGGGGVDLAKGNVSSRALYALSLPIYAGTIGALFQYLHTGKRPESLRDYYYPQNGLTDDKGRPDRASLPTYMKDVVAYSSDPVTTLEHKASPLLSLAFDLGTNRDFFGDMIRNPDEARSKQLLQMGSYALRQFRPFSVQQAMKTAAEGGVLRAGEQMMGFPSAPASMKQTPEESDRMKEARRLRNKNAMDAAKKKHGG